MPKLVKFLILFISLNLTVTLAEASEPRNEEHSFFMWWRLESQEKNKDGGMTASYRLIFPDESNVKHVEIFYQATPWSRSGSSRKYGGSELYLKKITTKESSQLIEFYSGRTERIELWAGLHLNGKFYVAQTIFNIYGNSGQDDYQAERVEAAPDWPAFQLEQGDKYYRSQTGESIQFDLSGLGSEKTVVEVIDIGNGETFSLKPDFESRVSYVPPHDPRLSEGGFSIKNDLVFVANISEGSSVVSFYTPVYRSSYGRLNLRGGLFVFLSCALFCLWLVHKTDKRFPWR